MINKGTKLRIIGNTEEKHDDIVVHLATVNETGMLLDLSYATIVDLKNV